MMAVINSTILEGNFLADFVNGITYPVHSLRRIFGTLAAKGVLPQTASSCKVIKLSDDKVKILLGRAVFEDGGIMTIDAEGVSLQCIEGVAYVYFKNGNLQG